MPSIPNLNEAALTEVIYKKNLMSASALNKALSEPASCFFVIYDEKLKRKIPGMRDWLSNFDYSLGVKAGEGLKSLENFPRLAEKVFDKLQKQGDSKACFVALGGGSVGDAVGFLASVYKRGVRYIQVPTTWLAALDSAHGGKTALNIGLAKNQIGSFHNPEIVLIARQVLSSQPIDLIRDAYGELLKMALLAGGELFSQLNNHKQGSTAEFWRLLPYGIQAKYRWVKQDPHETRKTRTVLNLGHTLGHVLELKYGLSHGRAVAEGLHFSILWSHQKGLLKKSSAIQALEMLKIKTGEPKQFRMTKREFLQLLNNDKKKNQSKIDFVFLKEIGRPEVHSVEISDIVDEARRQGWL